MPLGTEVGLGPGDIVLDRTEPPKGSQPHQFSAHVYCGQTAGWIKMPLATEVSLGPEDIVLDGAQLPPPKKIKEKGHGPQFSAHVYCGQRSPISATAELLLLYLCNNFQNMLLL